MKIVIIGAGAIGSFFGGLLSDVCDVTLVGRKKHVEKIKNNGLRITGKTDKKIKINAVEKIKEINYKPDFLIISVKSYDTEKAIKQSQEIIGLDTIIVSIQNGLNNIVKIKKYVSEENIFSTITTNGVVFKEPGMIEHTGIGKTIIGSITNKNKEKLDLFSKKLNESGIKNIISGEIRKEIWVKAIINSSINPLTAFFKCKNGYLIKNPVLEKIVERVCIESTRIANLHGLNLSINDMIFKTKEVIHDTSDNYSSMLQSINNNKKTEIDSINGIIYKYGKEEKLDLFLNHMLFNLIKERYD